MKNIKVKILLSVFVFSFAVLSFGIAIAAEPLFYISPTNLTSVVGESFFVSSKIDASGEKVCVISGNLVFNNLSCENIVLNLEEGVIAQNFPTCLNPRFVIGILGCTTENKVLFTAEVRGQSTGTASVSPFNLNIIGEGESINSIFSSGNYNITPAEIVLEEKPEIIETEEEAKEEIEEVSDIMTFKEELTEDEEEPLAGLDGQVTATEGDARDSLLALASAFLISPATIWIIAILMILLLASFAFKKAYKRK